MCPSPPLVRNAHSFGGRSLASLRRKHVKSACRRGAGASPQSRSHSAASALAGQSPCSPHRDPLSRPPYVSITARATTPRKPRPGEDPPSSAASAPTSRSGRPLSEIEASSSRHHGVLLGVRLVLVGFVAAYPLLPVRCPATTTTQRWVTCEASRCFSHPVVCRLRAQPLEHLPDRARLWVLQPGGGPQTLASPLAANLVQPQWEPVHRAQRSSTTLAAGASWTRE